MRVLVEVLVAALGLLAYASAGFLLMSLLGHPPIRAPGLADWCLVLAPAAAMVGTLLLIPLSILRYNDREPWLRLWVIWILAMAPLTPFSLLFLNCMRGTCV